MPDGEGITSTPLRPETIERIGNSLYPAFAMIAGMQMDLFTPLADGPMTARELAEAKGLGPEKLSQLLYVLVSAGLLTEKDGKFANTPEADHFLVQGRPAYLGGRHAFYTARCREIMQTAASVSTGCPQAKLDFGCMQSQELAAYFRGLHPATAATGRDLLTRADLSSCRHLLDVGGGSGGLALAIIKACPGLRATVIELPAVVPVTRQFIEEEGMAGRADVIACDVLGGTLPGRYDAAVLRAFIQVLSPEEARQALATIFRALVPDSTIYILGQVLDDSRVSPPESVAFNLVFLNVYDKGQAYTESEYRHWLDAAGFTGFTRTILPGGQSLVTARKPPGIPGD